MPTWVLASLVIIALGGAIWLFVAESGEEQQDASSPPATTTTKPTAKGVLDVADEDDQPESRRGTDTPEADDADDETAVDPTLPPTFAHLRGVTVTLAPASAEAADPSAGRAKIGDLRPACASGSDRTRLARELAALKELRLVLERAGATVSVLVDEQGRVTCVDARATALARTDMGIVVRSGDTDTTRVLPARIVNEDAAASASTRRATALAAEIAAALKLSAVTPGTATADRSLLTATAALEQRAASAIVLLDLASAPADAASAQLAPLALDIARGMAARASAVK